MQGWPGEWGARRGLVQVLEESGCSPVRGRAGAGCSGMRRLILEKTKSVPKVILEKTKNVPKVAGEEPPLQKRGKTSLTAFQEVYVAFRVGVIGWEVL